nr:RHS repeat-associated core domain-containing protein [Orenia metallireducens]
MLDHSDKAGNVLAEYDYDAWGNILSQSGSMAEINPYRYAGYYYDEETGLYYLRARYYDPEIGRFIRRDTVQKINQYAYAENNPVMLMDSNGNWAITIPYANTYNFARNVLSIGAAAYLLPRNYDLSYKLFNHGLFGYGQDLYFGQDSLLAQKVSQSNKFRTKLKKEIGNRSWFSFNSSIEFETGDLYYAIQHASYNVWGYRHYSGKLKVYVSMGDIYDFTEERPWEGFSNYANNLGYYSQKTGVITEYEWKADFIIYI